MTGTGASAEGGVPGSAGSGGQGSGAGSARSAGERSGAAAAGSGARISRAQVAHVAELARLDLAEEELDRLAGDLGAVLDYAAQVGSLDTHDVAPTAHPLGLDHLLRADVSRPGLERAAVLEQAPRAEDGRFRVPRILGEAP